MGLQWRNGLRWTAMGYDAGLYDLGYNYNYNMGDNGL
jgi:hypothetical protein